MPIHRSVLCVLALCVAMPAEAGGPKRPNRPITIFWKFNAPDVTGSSRVVVAGGSTASSVTASIKSDVGSEDVTLVESDAYLHGAASIKALPKTDATLTLTLYDKASASLMSFSGTLGTDGEVTLTADETKDTTDSTACALRAGCPDDTSDTSATPLDIEVLAAEVFAASGGYELGVDLAGADTYEVAYAAITVTESTEVSTCPMETRECTTTGSTTTTTTEVGWDEIGAVWEGELSVEPEGVIDVKVKTYDADGEEVENTKVALGVPWLDGGDGINVLGLDEDPLTTVGLARRGLSPGTQSVFKDRTGWAAAISSMGWTPTTVPAEAKVELTNGDTITIPVNSYQRGASGFTVRDVAVANGSIWGSHIIVTGGSLTYYDSARTEFGEPSCSNGTCFRFIKDEGSSEEYFVHVSGYATDATKLPDDLELTVTITAENGDRIYSETETVEFDDEVTAVFANELSFSEDPLGLDLSGEVSLLGAADSKGKQKTLSKGKFFGSFSRDGDGDLTLAGADKNAGSSEGSIVVAGDSVALELTDTNKDGVIDGPPIIAMYGDIILGSMKLDDFND